MYKLEKVRSLQQELINNNSNKFVLEEVSAPIRTGEYEFQERDSQHQKVDVETENQSPIVKRRISRLQIEQVQRTGENVGPGSYEIDRKSIGGKQVEANKKRQLVAVKNRYLNRVFTLPNIEDPFLLQKSDNIAESSVKSSFRARKKNPSSIPSPKAFNTRSSRFKSKDNTMQREEEDFISSKLVAFGSMYDRLKIRQTFINSKKIKTGEFRQAALPQPLL